MKATTSQRPLDGPTQDPDSHPDRPDSPPDRRTPFEAPAWRREERLTKMTADQQFFGAES